MNFPGVKQLPVVINEIIEAALSGRWFDVRFALIGMGEVVICEDFIWLFA